MNKFKEAATSVLRALATPFMSKDIKTKTKTAKVDLKVEGLFTVTIFIARQFIHGLTAMAMDTEKSKLTASTKRHLLLAKIAVLAIDLDPEDNKELPVFLTRDEVEDLKLAVEAKLAHCEKERAENNERFNPDTYIGLKLLLIDLRDWLSVSIQDIDWSFSEN